jgi:hypothetical protein
MLLNKLIPCNKCGQIFGIDVNKSFHDLYSSPTILRALKSRRMRWVGHVAQMGEGRGVYRVLVEKPEGKSHWGDPGVDGGYN